jgi:hypothetical protein
MQGTNPWADALLKVDSSVHFFEERALSIFSHMMSQSRRPQSEQLPLCKHENLIGIVLVTV